MEVASPPPAPFGSRAKRHFPGSPGFVDSTNRNPFATIPGDSSDEYMQQRSFKRRRFAAPDESMGTDTENNQNHAFMQFQHQPSMAKGNSSSFTTHGFSGHSSKRSRTENHQIAQLQQQQQQQVELQNEVNILKSEKNGLENSLATLRTEHEKVVNENKTLKRAVIIQQERQNQAVSEINAGRQYKAEAEDKIKKLEQLVLSLRYHLQAQQHNPPGNDWMGFRPPDVY